MLKQVAQDKAQKSINLTLRILAVATKSDFSLNVLHSLIFEAMWKEKKEKRS